MAQLIIKSNEEIEIMKAGAQILGKAHAEICKIIKPGISTMELERIAFQYIVDNNAKPSFKGYQGFPYTLCISLNDQVVHGMPNSALLKEGDIVSVDCGVFYQGFHTDSAYTYEVGNVKEDVKQLLKTTKESLYKGIEKAIVGNRIGDIAFEIQNYCESKGYSVVRELVGHGVGKNLHEKPEVPNYGQKGKGLKLVENMVLAIEPMINLGKRNVVQENDGWTIRTSDRLPSAHFEHTVAIKNNKAEVITTFDYIEEVLKNK
jgi:methionyl aminopeptidase